MEPPRDGDIDSRADVPWRIDWVAYKEFQVRWSVARLARMLRERGVDGVPIFHDVAYQYRTPLDLGRLEADPDIDWVGLNLYRPPEEHRPLADRVRFLAGSTRLPFVPELEAGLWSHHVRTALPEEEAFVTLSSLMYGVKAFNFYMLVERERWQGSPITRHGEYRPEYAPFYARLLAFLKRFEFWRFHRRPGAVVMLGYDLARYAAASSALDYGHADLLGLPWALFDDTRDLGFRWDVAREAHLREDSWPRRVMDALQSGSVDYDLADTHVASGRLASYPVVFLQAADFMSADDQQPLLEYARNGGALVVGPGMPYLDEHLRPKRVLAEHAMDPGEVSFGAGHLVWASDQDVTEWVRRLVQPAEFQVDDTRLEVVPHHHEDQTLLFVSNPTPQPIGTTLRFEGERTFSSAWAERRGEQARDELAVELRPYSVDIWAVSR